ncbi:MAG: hypothetical protein Q9188_002806 [Gyalolechia gomerana]
MAPPRLVFILVSVLTLTFLLTFFSLVQSHPRQYATSTSSPSPDKSNFRSLFSFRTPSALFPSSAIISLTDDNSTFFLARPADFGPSLPADGLSGQLWVGSGFGDDNLGRGLATETEGELGCSDVPGWRHGRKHHQGDGQFEPSSQLGTGKPGGSASGLAQSGESKTSVQDSRNFVERMPSDRDGTDDHLHHPLPASQVMSPVQPGRTAELQHHPGGQLPQHADIQSLQESAEISGKLVMLSRGGCGFLEKVKWVQRRGGAGLIVGDNTRGGALVTMYAKGDTSNVTIPALFTSRTTAHLLSSLIPPELPNNNQGLSEELSPETLSGKPIDDAIATKLGDDRPTFTPTAFSTTPTPSLSSKGFTRRPKEQPVSHPQQQQKAKGGWLHYLFGPNEEPRKDFVESGATADSRRPPSSGRLTWVNEQWTESAIRPGNDKRRFAHKDIQGSLSKQSELHRPDAHANSGDGFEIGVHDWRDPDLVGAKAAQSSVSSASRTSTKYPSATALNGVGNGYDDARTLSGGSITPGSGEYQKPAIAIKSGRRTPGESSSLPYDGTDERRGWLGRLFRRKSAEPLDLSPENVLHSRRQMESNSGRTSDNVGKREDHEGLWVTLTPTTMSTSPFFDTLLVLVVSPLITLTVVYSLLLIRSRIRRRRWRAPKSVVDRLPIRTYHTMSCSSTTSSSQFGTPTTSSPTSPLLQHCSPSPTPRSRPRSRAASGIGDVVNDSLDKATADASMKQKGTRAKLNAKKRQYHGKQIECVVCLEEYVDGQSKVMKLPCGHEFHAECM